MCNIVYNRLLKVFESFLGESKSGVTDGGQVQFNCPCCDPNGDGKYNLEVNFRIGKYKCWVCADTENTVGGLSKLIKEQGNAAILSEYYDIIRDARESNMYTFGNGYLDDEAIACPVELPAASIPMLDESQKFRTAIEYLKKRNIKSDIINRFNFRWTGKCEDGLLSNRIIIPSYDVYNRLNYWVGRDYTGYNKKYKYFNAPNIKKTDIIFNERFVDWNGDIRLVEGPFDHLVVPNSIPLLGKSLSSSFYLYHKLFQNANSTITIMLDADAFENVKKIYKCLNTGRLEGRIRYILLKGEWDPALIYQAYGPKGIAKALERNERFNNIELKIKTL